MKNITKDIYYVGCNDHEVDLFEGQYVVKNGMAYNSYIIKDEKIAVLDTIDQHFTSEWLSNVKEVLKDSKPDFLVVHHMEPDHSASIRAFLEIYPDATVVASQMALVFLGQYFPELSLKSKRVVKEGDVLELGSHSLKFIAAPMVHWPEVMVSYEASEKILFSADGFGKFGALDVDEPWEEEAARYYFGIVGKYGAMVQQLLKKLAGVPVEKICSLHGPVLDSNLGYYLDLYDKWSSYTPYKDGVLIAYTSVYGHTKEAVYELKKSLEVMGCENIVIRDIARTDMSENVALAFAYKNIVLATTTYCNGVYPIMNDFIERIVERNITNRTIGIIENGTWAPAAAKTIKAKLSTLSNVTVVDPTVTIRSAVNNLNKVNILALAQSILK